MKLRPFGNTGMNVSEIGLGAWQLANPDLRMGAPSFDWLAAEAGAASQARADLARIEVPTLVLEGDRAAGCRALPSCRAVRLAGGAKSLELEADAARKPWLEAIDSFVEARLPTVAPPGPRPSHP